MSGFNDFGKLFKQKKSRKLFWGMLAPLLFLTISACSFFYFVSNKILQEYMKNQLELSIQKLNATVVQSMQPIILNVDNFVTFSAEYDEKELKCKIYEIKHSRQIVEKQYKHLLDKKKCEETQFKYGEITDRIVLYNGEDKRIGDIQYTNVVSYLESLKARR